MFLQKDAKDTEMGGDGREFRPPEVWQNRKTEISTKWKFLTVSPWGYPETGVSPFPNPSWIKSGSFTRVLSAKRGET